MVEEATYSLEQVLNTFRSYELRDALKELGMVSSGTKGERIVLLTALVQGGYWRRNRSGRMQHYQLHEHLPDNYASDSSVMKKHRIERILMAFSEDALRRVCALAVIDLGTRREMALRLAYCVRLTEWPSEFRWRSDFQKITPLSRQRIQAWEQRLRTLTASDNSNNKIREFPTPRIIAKPDTEFDKLDGYYAKVLVATEIVLGVALVSGRFLRGEEWARGVGGYLVLSMIFAPFVLAFISVVTGSVIEEHGGSKAKVATALKVPLFFIALFIFSTIIKSFAAMIFRLLGLEWGYWR